MRKRILDPSQQAPAVPDGDYLDLERIAVAEISSEDPAHPVEAALQGDGGPGWRAATPGRQRLRLLFDEPQSIRRILLRFVETGAERTQEYVLRCSTDGGDTFRDIVRQQWNFSPTGTTAEMEDHRVELDGVTVLELDIMPDIGGGPAPASLAELRLA